MSSYVIWMDGHEGKIFNLSPEGVQTRHLRPHGHKDKLQPYDDSSKMKDHALDSFFKELCTEIKDAKEVLILGPSGTKQRFKHYLETHHKHTLGSRIAGVETVDHPTENQILAYARKFFKAYDAFHE